ncbi:MAG: rhodanese-like domain-containing protein [Lautropia sp.]
MSALNWELVRSTVSYWLGALSEPVSMVSVAQMQEAAAAGAIVWDVRDPDRYKQGHLPGALSLGTVDWLLADSFGGNLIPAKVIEGILGNAGIGPGRRVVIYSAGRAVDAFVALRALRSIGIDDAQVCLGDVEAEAAPVAAALPLSAVAG